MKPKYLSNSVVLGVLLATLLGCSDNNPPLGKVSGRVTLDDKPLSGVIINFKPDDGRAATATTDQDGMYTLEFSYGVAGAKVGPNTVMFEWPLDGANGPPIPKKYTGLQSELKADVKKGSNQLDFPLKSK